MLLPPYSLSLGCCESATSLEPPWWQFGLFGGGSLLALAMPDGRGAKRKGMAEQVTVYDPLVVQLANLLPEANDRVLRPTYTSFGTEISRLGSMFGMFSVRFTQYCLRRGGATWHFAKFNRYDATQHLGRWAHSKTETFYIDQATAETTELSRLAGGRKRLLVDANDTQASCRRRLQRAPE